MRDGKVAGVLGEVDDGVGRLLDGRRAVDHRSQRGDDLRHGEDRIVEKDGPADQLR